MLYYSGIGNYEEGTMYKGRVYFDHEGNHMRYMPYWWTDDKGVERDNFIFKDTLVFDSVGIIHNVVYWHSKHTNRVYTSFARDLNKFIPKMVNGEYAGFFTFRNNGGKTSVIPIDFEYEDYTPGK